MNNVGRTTAFKREKKAQAEANPRVNTDSCAEQHGTIITDCHYLLHWLCSDSVSPSTGFKNYHNQPHTIITCIV